MIEKQGTLDQIKSVGIPVYCGGRLAFIDHLQSLPTGDPVLVDFFMLAVCQRGHGTIIVNGHDFQLGENQILVCHPNVILEPGSFTDDMEFLCICVSRDYLLELPIVDRTNIWDLLRFLEKSPVQTLKPEDVRGFSLYYHLMRDKLSGKPQNHQSEIMDALLQAFLYEFADVIEEFVHLSPEAYTAASNVFRRFLELLTTTYPKPRSVSWYADKLCLTPKYLSSVCKDASGETGSELINRYVVKDIEYLLKKRGKSIKEICNELEFPNLSFFGRYVKKHLGYSPKMYREKVLEMR